MKRIDVRTWSEFLKLFESHIDQLSSIDQLSPATRACYRSTLNQFDRFLRERRITSLHAIGKSDIERYKVWRLAQIRKANCNGGATLHRDLTLLHHVFEFARDTLAVGSSSN
jgi:site-specific recombinase XerD